MCSSARFRWRTALCTEIHAFFCAFRYANCPQGYEYKTWVSPTNGFESEKCFKLNPVGGLIEGAQMWVTMTFSRTSLSRRWRHSVPSHHSVHSADELCRSEGSRLFVPQTMHEARMVADLLWEVGRDYVSDPTSVSLCIRRANNTRIPNVFVLHVAFINILYIMPC